MLCWADELIQEYTNGRQELNKRADQVDRNNPIELNDLKHLNSMVSDMTFSLDWMTTGRQPNNYRGADKKGIYQKRSYENIDLIPDIEMQLREENDINKKHLFMTREEKIILADILSSFSLRERQCYILHQAQRMSMSAIADEIGVSKSAVQYYIRMAKNKVKERIKE